MVFLTVANLIRVIRSPTVDNSWKRRWAFTISQHFYGRRRNCYRIAIKGILRALYHSTVGREIRKTDLLNLYETRINAACIELGTDKNVLLEGLANSNVILDRKILSELAIREPRTFKCLTDIAVAKFAIDPPKRATITEIKPPPPGVITRGML